jgi:hypothetical protein
VRPDESNGWMMLVEPLLRQGRRAEAEEAARQAETLTSSSAGTPFLLHRDLIRTGRYTELDRELAAAARSVTHLTSSQARWLWILALRDQGRLVEALKFAQDGTIPGSDSRIQDLPPDLVNLAIVPFENGHPLESAARFRRQAAEQRAADLPPALKARAFTWSLMLAGTALAAARDTAGLRAIADTIELTGRGSTFGRDATLHHFLLRVAPRLRVCSHPAIHVDG